MDIIYHWLGFVIFWFWVGTVSIFILAAIILSFIPAPGERRAARTDQGVV